MVASGTVSAGSQDTYRLSVESSKAYNYQVAVDRPDDNQTLTEIRSDIREDDLTVQGTM